MAKRGRPSIYSEELADKICDYVIDGKSLREISRLKDTPNFKTLQQWLKNKEEFASQYARAKNIQIDLFIDEIIKTIDDLDITDLDGKEANAKVQICRLRVDTLKWIACKLLPKKYGDKQEISLSGFDNVFEQALKDILGLEWYQAVMARVAELKGQTQKKIT